MNLAEQKLHIESMLSSPDIFARCAGVLQGEYFDAHYLRVINYLKEYYDQYNGVPSFDLVNAKFDFDVPFKSRIVPHAEKESTAQEIAAFCKQQAVMSAVYKSVDDIDNHNHGMVMERLTKAMMIELQRDMGVEMFTDVEQSLLNMLETQVPYSTGMKGLDDYLDGGLFRKTLTLFSANSGGGKSVMLSNLACNYSILHQLNVLTISLELPETMVRLRNTCIITGYGTKVWKENIPNMASKMNVIKAQGAGRNDVKRLPNGSTINDVRSYLKQYEVEFGVVPDVIIIDYLDQLQPNEGIKNLSVSEQDKQKTEQYVQLLHDYDAIGITASQQNRDAIGMAAPDQSVIAGGMTKVNTVDNYVSIYMDPAMRIKGEMTLFYLKTRSSDGVGKSVNMHFDSSNLRISDIGAGGIVGLGGKLKERKKEMEANKDAAKLVALTGEGAAEVLPGLEGKSTTGSNNRIDNFLSGEEDSDDAVKITVTSKKRESVADVSKLLKEKKAKVVKAQPTSDEIADKEEVRIQGIEAAARNSVKPRKYDDDFLTANGLSKECMSLHATFFTG